MPVILSTASQDLDIAEETRSSGSIRLIVAAFFAAASTSTGPSDAPDALGDSCLGPRHVHSSSLERVADQDSL